MHKKLDKELSSLRKQIAEEIDQSTVSYDSRYGTFANFTQYLLHTQLESISLKYINKSKQVSDSVCIEIFSSIFQNPSMM